MNKRQQLKEMWIRVSNPNPTEMSDDNNLECSLLYEFKIGNNLTYWAERELDVDLSLHK